jgi:glycine cleavage system regulatory protein
MEESAASVLVLTVIGPDRPGIVQRLSDIVGAHGANWEESRMARLSGRFAGILRVTVPRTSCDELIAALGRIDGNLRVMVELDEPKAHATVPTKGLDLSVVGNDHPGIVRDISRLLAGVGVNVEELSTECVDAPHAGGRLFRAVARLKSPETLALADLRRRLEALAAELMVDLEIRDEPR